jgi:hypothetical protein
MFENKTQTQLKFNRFSKKEKKKQHKINPNN